MITSEPFEWWHARRFGVLRAVPEAVGYTVFEDGTVIALGVAAERDGEIWLTMAGRMRPIFHRLAIRLLKELEAAGVERVFASADPAIPGSDVWLRRLGFEPLENGEWRIGLGARDDAIGGSGGERRRPVRAFGGHVDGGVEPSPAGP